MVVLHRAGQIVDGEQPLTDGVGQGVEPKVRVDAVFPHREGDVHLALAHLGQAVLGPLLVAQPDAGGLPFQLAQVERREQGKGAVHAGDDELPLGGGRVKIRRLDQVVQRQQDRLQLLLQAEGACCGFQPVGRAHEQGSSKVSRSRPRALLTADWLRCRRRAARLPFRSSSKTCRIINRLRSIRPSCSSNMI